MPEVSKYNRNYKSLDEKLEDSLELMKKYDCLPMDYHMTRDFFEYLLRRIAKNESRD